MDGTLGSTFSGSNDVSSFGMGDRNVSDIILMCWEACDVLWLILLFLNTTEEFLLVCAQSLNNTKSCGNINDLIVGSSETKARLVSVTSITVDVFNLPGLIWSILHLLVLILLWNSLVNVFEEVLNFSCLDTLLF